MKKLYILGAGGLGREVLWHVQNNQRLLAEYELVGFLDDLNPSYREVNGLNVVGDTNLLLNSKEEVGVIIAIGCRYVRKEKFEILQVNNKVLFPNMLAQGINLSETVKLGQGNIILYDVNFTVNIELGDFNLIYLKSILTHDVKLGNYNSIYSGVIFSGAVQVKDFCEFGTGSIVIPGVKIASETVVGAGAVVIRDTEGNETVVGVPAKKIK